MIIQSARAGALPFVITMDEHTALSGAFASHFGNSRFEGVAPRELMLHVISHHDAGWRELDALALRDPATGVPYHLVQTPFARIVETSTRSADRNGERHPYCELLSSMHSWGLYNGRYGMSDKVLLNGLAADNRALADGMLAAEIARQSRLLDALGSDPETAPWIEKEHLFQNYKQLQFFDTLALYFNCTPEGQRGHERFTHVPMSANEDTSITVEPVAEGVYGFAPFPFDRDDLEITFKGRYLAPVDHGDNMREQLSAAPSATQTIRLVALD